MANIAATEHKIIILFFFIGLINKVLILFSNAKCHFYDIDVANIQHILFPSKLFCIYLHICCDTGTFTRQIPKISLISVACPYLNLNNRKSSMDKSLRFVHAAFFNQLRKVINIHLR